MILVSSPSKPFTYTTKNTARRLPAIEDYEDEIQALYDTVEDNILPDIPPPCQWDATSTVGFIRAVVRHILKQPLSDEDDLFEYGCDR